MDQEYALSSQNEPRDPNASSDRGRRNGLWRFFGGVRATLSPAERFMALGLLAALVTSAAAIIWIANRAALVTVPLRGGSLEEGIVGSPRFVNPLLSASDADRDLTALVYSGLLKATPAGILAPDLAEAYEISDDGLEYMFVLREDAMFHDGTPVTSADVVFTVTRAQDSRLKSSKRANWEDVTVEALDERHVRFTLLKPYAPFLENATLGILPKHLWEETSVQEFPFSSFNIKPVGSGPYRVQSVRQNNSGIPVAYTLTAFKNYSLGQPYVKTITVRFYPNEDELITAFNRGEIESMNGISPERIVELGRNVRIERSALPRIFAVFFNQNQAPIFSHKEVREALNVAIDRNALVAAVLAGYGTPIRGPLPPGILPAEPDPLTTDAAHIEAAQEILTDAGWKRNEETRLFEKTIEKTNTRLSFSIATTDTPELKAAAEYVKTRWELLGAQVELKIFETGDLAQNVIRPRKYDALLFGEVVGRDLDLFAFWHSSQRNDPGLNIALYTNITADKLLEDARGNTENETRVRQYLQFAEEVEQDVPAVFLYAPDLVYVLPKRIEGFAAGGVTVPEERFISITDWYTETERIWPIFVRDEQH